VQRLTLGTLMMSALFLAGCGGGSGAFTPHAANQTGSASGVRHVKTFREGLAAGDLKAVCPAVPPGRARCVSYMLSAKGAAAAGLTRSTLSNSTAPPPGYGPADLQSAYRLTAAARSNGTGSVIAIVDAYDNPRAEQDLAVYRARYGLPPCTTANRCFQKVNQSGKSGPLPPMPPPEFIGWVTESSLDLDMVSANCPKCRILLVESDDDFFNNLGAAVDTAARFRPVAISNSYVGQESATDVGPVSHDGLLPYYVHPHIAVVAGSGDYGYALSGWNFGALIPAAFPSVIAAGGTDLWPDASSPRGWSEIALDAGGSGCSMFEPAPPWQKPDPNCVGSYTSPSGRMTTFPSRIYADVAYSSSAYDGVAFYDTNVVDGNDGWGTVGGTSVASPAIAAIYGLARSAVRGEAGESDDGSWFPARKLYSSKGSLFDITSGSNGDCIMAYFCTAVPGYDGPTGNGTPNGIAAFRE
jgi:subtilase family serine protease